MPLDVSAPPVAGISLRPIEDRDSAFLRGLYRSAREHELDLTSWDEPTKRAFIDSQFDLQDRWYREQYGGAMLLVIERDGAPAGRLYLCEMPGELHVLDIALVPAARNGGVGTALLEWLKEAAAREHRKVTLYVETYNPVRRLYARLGFVEEASEGIYIRMRWAPLPS
jgi:ribosomal protein S18 acetylase RimI-like enzyme